MVSSITSTAVSGMWAAQTRLDVSANNVANASTPGYRAQSVSQAAAPGSAGVSTSVQRQEAEGVAMEKEAVEQMAATYAFKANLQVVKAQDQMMGSLLNVRA